LQQDLRVNDSFESSPEKQTWGFDAGKELILDVIKDILVFERINSAPFFILLLGFGFFGFTVHHIHPVCWWRLVLSA